jgi:hypothetical protein
VAIRNGEDDPESGLLAMVATVAGNPHREFELKPAILRLLPLLDLVQVENNDPPGLVLQP